MKWRRIGEQIEIRYTGLDRIPGYEVQEGPRAVTIYVKRGTAFCGRPIYRYTVYLKGKKLENGVTLLTHWAFHEEPAPMGPATLGFSLFFPEIIEGAYRRTPLEEQEQLLWNIIEELKEETGR